STQYRTYPVFAGANADAHLTQLIKGGTAQHMPLAAMILLQFQSTAAAVKCIGLQVHILLLIRQHIHLKINARRFAGSYLQTTARTYRHTTIVTVRRPYPIGCQVTMRYPGGYPFGLAYGYTFAAGIAGIAVGHEHTKRIVIVHRRQGRCMVFGMRLAHLHRQIADGGLHIAQVVAELVLLLAYEVLHLVLSIVGHAIRR